MELAYDIHTLLTGGVEIRFLSAMFKFRRKLDIREVFPVLTYFLASLYYPVACVTKPQDLHLRLVDHRLPAYLF